MTALAAVDDEVAGFEHTQVLHDRESRERGKTRREVAGGAGAVAKHVEHLAAKRIRERAPYRVEIGLPPGRAHM